MAAAPLTLQALDEYQNMNKDNDDYKVIFGGATISKLEAKRVGATLILGMIGIVTLGLTLGLQNKLQVFIMSFALACIGYFGIAKRIYK
ncbi:hypothetical protein [Geomonas oryzae]|uniref:hypothetical protein n=1 Tax=Geomonas oryzae TaxID=2364273 RepID=UPI00100A7975|nr:hypothetical protein [Geomonas oryzae]